MKQSVIKLCNVFGYELYLFFYDIFATYKILIPCYRKYRSERPLFSVLLLEGGINFYSI